MTDRCTYEHLWLIGGPYLLRYDSVRFIASASHYWSGRRVGASMREMAGLDDLADMVRRRQGKGERKRNRWRLQ